MYFIYLSGKKNLKKYLINDWLFYDWNTESVAETH